MQRFSSGSESKGDREASLQKMTGRLSREGTLVSVRPVPSFLPEHEVQDFPGGWAAGPVCSQCRGPGSLPGWATRSCMPQLRPDAATHTHTHTQSPFFSRRCFHPVFLVPRAPFQVDFPSSSFFLSQNALPCFGFGSLRERDFPGSSVVKNPPPMQEPWVRSLGREDALEKGKATHFSILVWEIPQSEEAGGLQSTGSQRVRYDSD